MMKRIGVVLSTILLAAGLNVAQAADASAAANNNAGLKVAIVNVQQVLQQSPRVAQLSKKLEGEFKPRQDKINQQQKDLQDELDNFKKESPTMSQADRDSTQKKIADDRANLVKQVVAYQQDLQKAQSTIMQGILSDLNSIVSTIAKSNSYNLVLDSQAVIYAGNGADITKDVAKQFNSKA